MGERLIHINKTINSFVKSVFGTILGIDYGEFTVARGTHQIEIPVELDGDFDIWIYTDQSACEGCGQCCINKTGGKVTETGIMFDLDIKTDTCTISWFAAN